MKLFALAVAAQQLEGHPYTVKEKSEQAQLAYRIIGEELCKAVFADETEAWLVNRVCGQLNLFHKLKEIVTF